MRKDTNRTCSTQVLPIVAEQQIQICFSYNGMYSVCLRALHKTKPGLPVTACLRQQQDIVQPDIITVCQKHSHVNTSTLHQDPPRPCFQKKYPNYNEQQQEQEQYSYTKLCSAWVQKAHYIAHPAAHPVRSSSVWTK